MSGTKTTGRPRGAGDGGEAGRREWKYICADRKIRQIVDRLPKLNDDQLAALAQILNDAREDAA